MTIFDAGLPFEISSKYSAAYDLLLTAYRSLPAA
jgi:hypothetical protein